MNRDAIASIRTLPVAAARLHVHAHAHPQPSRARLSR